MQGRLAEQALSKTCYKDKDAQSIRRFECSSDVAGGSVDSSVAV
jgi:hypothetical protein